MKKGRARPPASVPPARRGLFPGSFRSPCPPGPLPRFPPFPLPAGSLFPGSFRFPCPPGPLPRFLPFPLPAGAFSPVSSVPPARRGLFPGSFRSPCPPGPFPRFLPFPLPAGSLFPVPSFLFLKNKRTGFSPVLFFPERGGFPPQNRRSPHSGCFAGSPARRGKRGGVSACFSATTSVRAPYPAGIGMLRHAQRSWAQALCAAASSPAGSPL